MKKILTLTAAAALALTLTACSDGTQDSVPATTGSSTTSATEEAAVEESTTDETSTSAETTPTDVIPETVQQEIEEASTQGRGPRPPLDDMALLDGFGYVGIYMGHDSLDHYLCDARGTPSMDIMGDDGCSQPMEWGEIQEEFEASLLRSVDTR